MARVRRGQGIRLTLQILLVLMLSLLLWAILSFESARTASELRREKAAEATLNEVLLATGYVFRDEVALTSHDNGPVLYAVPNGSSQAAGAVLATVYADGANVGTRAAAAVLLAEIERLLAVDEPDYLPDYYGAYYDMMASLSLGAVPGTDASQQTVKAALDLIAAHREAQTAREAYVASLQAELAALIENDLNANEQVLAPTAGIFYRTADGYESVMGVAAVETLTPGGLRALLLSPQSTATTVGRLLVGQTWYLAVPTTGSAAAGLTVNTAYEVDFLRTGERMTLTLSRISDPDASGEVLLIFCAEGIMPPADFARSEEISITVGEQSGILVPMVALREENGVRGVYVAENGKASFRAVEVLTERDGCCLVLPQMAEGYLKVGEEIVVTSRRIFSGKVLP